MNNIKIYHGTTPKSTHKIISEESNHGVCLNLFNGYKKIIKTHKYLESIKVPLFIDNGSFERFGQFLKGELSVDEYFNYDTAYSYFVKTTEEYKVLLESSINTREIILTIPEIIGNGELTQKLQKEFIPQYLELEKKFDCEIIIALQFNPKSENWKKEIDETAIFIKNNAPKSWVVGIPFGNDFKIIQNEDNYKKIVEVFNNILSGYFAHLFACGTINKIKKFAKYSFIKSIDSSSINLWSRNAHYLSYTTEKLIDIRHLRGIKCSERLTAIKHSILKNEGINPNFWMNECNTSCRFRINLKNYIRILNIIFFKK